MQYYITYEIVENIYYTKIVDTYTEYRESFSLINSSYNILCSGKFKKNICNLQNR